MGMLMEFGFVAGMLMVMHPAVGVVMGFCAPGVGVHGPSVAVGMVMDVQMGMAVFMFMLQLPDGCGRALTIGK
jgi:hypothetical protein